MDAVHRWFSRSGHRREILGAAGDALAFELEPGGREAFAPFEGATMDRYATRLAALSGADDAPRPNTSTVQRALSGPQDKGLVWRATRGVYAMEQTRLAELMRGAGVLDA